MIHTCTRCPLRFTTRAEVADHMSHDHRIPRSMLQSISYPGSHEAAPLYRAFTERDGVHRILLVANQTLGADEMMDAIRGRMSRHEQMSVLVLVPATPSEHIGAGPGGSLDARTDDAGLAAARFRLRRALGALADEGVVAHGMVGDPNPMTAIAAVMREEQIDEMIVCTLHRAMSRWLSADLPMALERRYTCPITVITVDVASAGEQVLDLDGTPTATTA